MVRWTLGLSTRLIKKNINCVIWVKIDKIKLVLDATKDTTYIVYYQSGCFVDKFEIGNYLINFVLKDYPEPFLKNDYSEAELNKLLFEFNK